MSATWSSAIVRFEYGRWSCVVGGLLLRPYPRRSGATTVKRVASAGATRCHITCVCGCPCSSNNGGPLPPCRTRSVTSPMSMLSRVKPSNIGASYFIVAARECGTTSNSRRHSRNRTKQFRARQKAQRAGIPVRNIKRPARICGKEISAYLRFILSVDDVAIEQRSVQPEHRPVTPPSTTIAHHHNRIVNVGFAHGIDQSSVREVESLQFPDIGWHTVFYRSVAARRRPPPGQACQNEAGDNNPTPQR